jgi:hypothetical protein
MLARGSGIAGSSVANVAAITLSPNGGFQTTRRWAISYLNVG